MRARFLHRLGTILAGFLLLGVGTFAQQPTTRGGSQEERVSESDRNVPAINDVRIHVWDMALEEYVQEVEPGGSVVIEPGQQVRLRMVVKQRRNARSSYYPATRFSAKSSEVVTVDKVNPEVGSIIVTGRDRRSRNVVIDYEILEDWEIPANLRTGRVIVHVESAQDVAADEPEETAPGQLGAVLFEHTGYRGVSERFLAGDDADLGDNSIGNDRLSSIRVDRGCTVRLFQETGFRGDFAVLVADRPDMAEVTIGDDTASSIQIRCQGRGDGSARRGATVYAGVDLSGKADYFPEGGYPDMDGTQVGNDHASSVIVTEGCVATLYEDEDFRGRFYEVRGQQNDLRYTAVGNDRLSSLRVDCE